MSTGTTVEDLDLPRGRACRCGGRMNVEQVEEMDYPLVIWACRCGRRFGCQVDPATNEIVTSEWLAP